MRKYIPHIIIALLLAAGIFQWADRSALIRTIATETQKGVEYQNTIDANKSAIKALEAKYKKLADSIPMLNAQIAAGKLEIIKIQKERDEKIKTIDRYTVSDLQRFFDERYGAGK